MANNGIEEIITTLYEMVQDAWSLPLGNEKCVVERDKVLDLLDEISNQLPGELKQAEALAPLPQILLRELYRAIADYVPLDTLLAEADVVSLHCPLFPETAGIINRESIAKMKDGAILINNSRGGLIVEQDLADALNSGKLCAAGLDVASSEPIRADNPLLHAKNCIITPHISWAAGQSRVRILEQTVENVKAFLAGKPVNVVN